MAEAGSLSQEQMHELLFMQVVMMFQSAAFQHMGKVMNPVTQKVERDLAQAKNAIDILGMLEEKTKGNLTDDEEKMLERALFELRMNYVDEVNKGQTQEEAQKDETQGSEASGEQKQGDQEAGDASAEDESPGGGTPASEKPEEGKAEPGESG